MRKSIIEIENRLNKTREFDNLISTLSNVIKKRYYDIIPISNLAVKEVKKWKKL